MGPRETYFYIATQVILKAANVRLGDDKASGNLRPGGNEWKVKRENKKFTHKIRATSSFQIDHSREWGLEPRDSEKNFNADCL